MENAGELGAHLTTSAVIVYLIEWLKNAGWFTWMRVDSGTVNRVVSAVVAAVTALGISYSYDAATGVLILKGLTWSMVGTAAYHWLHQFVLQQMIYDGVVQKRGTPAPVPVVVEYKLPSSLPGAGGGAGVGVGQP